MKKFEELENKVIVNIEIPEELLRDRTEEGMAQALAFAKENMEEIYVEGVKFMAETMFAVRVGTGLNKDIEAFISDPTTGDKYHAIFKKL